MHQCGPQKALVRRVARIHSITAPQHPTRDLQHTCMNAGCVATKVVSPTARPTLATLVSGTKCWGKKGVRNSQLTHAVNISEVVNRNLCSGRQVHQDRRR